MSQRVRVWFICSAVYVVASLAIALVAHGTDLDQLTSRSAISRAAAVADDVLWTPYRWAGRQFAPGPGVMRFTTPVLLVANALGWGAALAALRQLLPQRKTQQ